MNKNYMILYICLLVNTVIVFSSEKKAKELDWQTVLRGNVSSSSTRLQVSELNLDMALRKCELPSYAEAAKSTKPSNAWESSENYITPNSPADKHLEKWKKGRSDFFEKDGIVSVSALIHGYVESVAK